MQEEYPDTSIFIRKLYASDDDCHLETIRNQNLNDIDKWKKNYPNHSVWINQVVKELIDDTNNRIAFGGFYYDKKGRKEKLCCSVIVKKNPFSPYLEIKNLIVFDHNTDGNKAPLEKAYQKQLIKHIQKFAQQRGYPKLIIELLNKNNKDKELIKLFIENDFTISGNRINKYNDADEVLFLTCDINQAYGYDSYDNISASLWIVSKFLNGEEYKQLEKASLSLVDSNESKHNPSAFSFFSGKKFSDEITRKFNNTNELVIIEEYFKNLNKIDRLKKVIVEKNEVSRFYIFDFSHEYLINNSVHNDKVTVFNREELDTLLGYSPQQPNIIRRCRYEDIGGLLLISNPTRFDFQKAKQILNDGNQFLYLKLGDYGKYLPQDKPLVLTYYNKNSNRSKLRIWGLAYISSPAGCVDLNSLREESNAVSAQSDGKLYSDGQMFFDFLRENRVEEDDIMEGDEMKRIPADIPLWDVGTFDKHNKYNATGRIIYYSVNKFIDLSNDSSEDLDISNFFDARLCDLLIDDAFDVYLTYKEIEQLESKIKTFISPPGDSSPASSLTTQTIINEFKLLFVAAMPSDKHRYDLDYEFIRDLFEKNKRIFFLTPTWSADYATLLDRLTKEKPNILHFSGHGVPEGILLENKVDNKAQLLKNDELKEIFEQRTGYLKVVVLNSCFSSMQAKIISKENIYVVGLKGEIDGSIAKHFASFFYAGFLIDPPSNMLEQRIKQGCKNFAKNFPDNAAQVSIWKDGDEIDYDTFKKIETWNQA